MPISEDEFDYHRSQEPQSSMSKAELRKTHKPIIEKRRRAKINHFLNEIKTLILEAMNKDPARHTKLEKADILEMAVQYLQNLQRQHLAVTIGRDPSVLQKFKNGFNECATEIDRYMNQFDGVDTAMKQRVTNHLQKCIGGIEQATQFSFPGFSLPILPSSIFTSNQTQGESSTAAGDQNNNPRVQIPQGIQLIPSRLPSGELALLVPNSSNLPYFPSAIYQSAHERPSAFAAVVPQVTVSGENLVSKPLSPPLSPMHQEEVRVNNPSPQGFRPVLSSKQRIYSEDHQVPQISSTVSSEKQQFAQPLEVKTLKYPIHKYSDKEKIIDSPKKIIEPLCIITNQSERYKQAQMKEDSANYEENVVHREMKRKFQDTHHQQSLLTFSQNDFYSQPPKIAKSQTFNESHSCLQDNETVSNMVIPLNRHDHSTIPLQEEVKDQPSDSNDNNEGNSDMWRPW